MAVCARSEADLAIFKKELEEKYGVKVLTKAADMMMEQGAASVRAVCTHAVLSGDAYDRINKSALTELIVSDTIPLDASKANVTSKIKQLTVAGLFGDVIKRVQSHESISSHFIIA